MYVAGEKLNVGLPGVRCISFLEGPLEWGSCLSSFESFRWWTQVRRPIFGKGGKSYLHVSSIEGVGKKWTHGIERLPPGKDADSVAICAQKTLSFSRPPQTPTFHPKRCAAPQRIIDSLIMMQCSQKERRGNYFGVHLFLAERCCANCVPLFFVFSWVD